MSNKRWIEENEKHVLYFEPFYEEEKIAEVFEEDDGGWCLTSEMLNSDCGYLGSDSLDDAKSEVEAMVKDHFENERGYYAEMLNRFEEE